MTAEPTPVLFTINGPIDLVPFGAGLATKGPSSGVIVVDEEPSSTMR